MESKFVTVAKTFALHIRQRKSNIILFTLHARSGWGWGEAGPFIFREMRLLACA